MRDALRAACSAGVRDSLCVHADSVMAVLEDCICFALSEQGKIRDTVMYCDIEQVEEQDGEDTIGTGTARAFSKKRGARGPVTMRHEHERSREGTSFRIFDGSHHRNYFFRCVRLKPGGPRPADAY